MLQSRMQEEPSTREFLKFKHPLLIYFSTSVYTLLYVGVYLLSKPPVLLLNLIATIYPGVTVELYVLVHELFTTFIVSVLAYFLYRVSTSKAMLTVTIAYLYSTILGGEELVSETLYFYLLTIVVLASSTVYGRSLRVGCGVLKSKITAKVYSLCVDYGLPLMSTLTFAWITLTLTGTFRDYTLKYTPQPYRYIFGNLVTTRFGALISTTLLFLVYLWLVREVLDIPALYVSTTPREGLKSVLKEVSREVEKLSLEPKTVVSAVSFVVGILTSYTLWFVLYDELLKLQLVTVLPEPIRGVMVFLTLILTSIVFDGIVRRKMLAGLKSPGKPSYKSTLYAIVGIAALLTLLYWAYKVEPTRLLIEGVFESKTLQDPLSSLAELLDESLGPKLNSRIKSLEDLAKLLISIVWR